MQRVLLLHQYGPNLPRPYSDVLHGSKKLKNLKELRNQTQNHLLRVSYYFDLSRKAFLLTGGDKKGKDQDKFYKDLIAESEVIVESMRRSWKMKDAIKTMESNMPPESVRRAHIKTEQDIMTIRLAQLREEQNVKQSEMANFTQSSVSKIEKRKDIKISTLIDYLDSLGMGLEIITYPKIATTKRQEKVLLKV